MKIKVIKEHTFIENLLDNKDIVIIDLGSCRGEFINEMNNLYNIKKAILVEPNPSNFIHLEEKENYVLYNKLVSSKDNEIFDFYEDVKSPYNGSIIFNYFNGKIHKIETISLNRIVIENNIEKIDLLKIDIEGSEYDVLENIDESLLKIISQITVEFHDFIDPKLKEKTNKIINKIESLGFKRISNPIKYMYNSDNYDVLFYK